MACYFYSEIEYSQQVRMKILWERVSDCRVSSFLNNRACVRRDFYSMPKLGEFVHCKTKTLFRIAWHFWKKRNTPRGFQLQFLWILLHESFNSVSQHEYFQESPTSRFYSMPKLEKFLKHTKPKLYLKSVNISKQRSTTLRRIKCDISW